MLNIEANEITNFGTLFFFIYTALKMLSSKNRILYFTGNVMLDLSKTNITLKYNGTHLRKHLNNVSNITKR